MTARTLTHLRHAELVFSIHARRPPRVERLEAIVQRQIAPRRIGALDQIDLPVAMPALRLFLAQDGMLHVAEELDIDEAGDTVTAGEAAELLLAVLPPAAERVGGDADVDGAAALAGEDVDRGCPDSHVSALVASVAHGC